MGGWCEGPFTCLHTKSDLNDVLRDTCSLPPDPPPQSAQQSPTTPVGNSCQGVAPWNCPASGGRPPPHQRVRQPRASETGRAAAAGTGTEAPSALTRHQWVKHAAAPDFGASWWGVEACRSTLECATCFLVHEQLSGDVKERPEKEKPLPVQSVVRSTDVRWAAVFLAFMYWRGCLVPFKQFRIDMVQVLDEAPETVATFAAFGKLGYPPTYGLKHATAQQIFLGDRWCLALTHPCGR